MIYIILVEPLCPVDGGGVILKETTTTGIEMESVRKTALLILNDSSV